MNQPTQPLTNFLLRLAALLVHAILNFIAVSYAVNFDISGSWLRFIGFVLLVFFLIYIFLLHLVSFINFIKNK